MAMAESQSGQRRDRQIHNRRSPEVNFGRFLADRRSTPLWWRRARFSSPGQHGNGRSRTALLSVAKSEVRKMSIGEGYE